MFTKTFFQFFTGFLMIIAAAVGVMIYTSSKINSTPAPVDIVAQPK